MNPFFEQEWHSAHTALIMYVRDSLQARLPPDLIAAPEQEVVTIGGGPKPITYRPDVQVREPWTLKEPSPTEVAEPPEAALPPVATEPIRVLVEDEIERWIEIREASGRLITVLELFSPSNKLESAERDRYLRKRRRLVSGGANVVEMDLVRKGAWLFPEAVRQVLQQAGACYGICAIRAERRGEYEVYPIRLRERLPAVRVPLRPTDADVVLDLQPLIDQCHERGRYHFLDYRRPLEPPLSPEDAAWAEQLLRRNDLL